MNNRTHIENELKSIAPGLLNVPATMPYTLPPAYFSGFASEVLSSIKKETELPIFLAGCSKEMPYSVPSNYFEHFSGSVLQRLYVESLSDQELGLLNNLSKTAPYTVPSGYFENFSKTVLQKIKEEEQQQTIPTGYFESLSDLMLAKVRKLDTVKELDEVAPLLNTISKQPVQHLPQGYFENLQPVLPSEIVNSTTPVVSIRKKTNWLKYAVAACLVGVLGLSTYWYFGSKIVNPSIANQPSASIINNELTSIDAATIEHYLQNNSSSLESHTVHYNNVQINDLDDLMLEDFSDQQLQKSLEETPEIPVLTKAQKI